MSMMALVSELQEKIVDYVLAADMTRHFEFVGYLKGKITSKCQHC